MPRSGLLPKPRRGRVALAAVSATCAAAALAAPAQGAHVRIARPVGHVHRAHKVVFLAVTDRPARRVRFYIDGKVAWSAHRAPYRFHGAHGLLNLRALPRGRHRLSVSAEFGHHWVRSRPVIVPGAKATAVAAAAAVTGAAAGTPSSPSAQAPPAPAAQAPAQPSNVAFDGDFSTGDLSQWDLVQDVSDERIQVVPAPGGRPGLAGRFEVRNGDHVNGETDSRSEVLTHKVEFGEGDTYQFDWATYFPTDFPTIDPSLWQDIVQWHNEGTGSPPLQIAVYGDQVCASAGPQVNWARPWCATYTRGVWHQFSVRMHFSSDPGAGWVDITYDGQHVLDHYKMATLFPGLKNYLKQGYFRAAAAQPTAVVYHAGMTVTRV